jgi:hypothetical protein
MSAATHATSLAANQAANPTALGQALAALRTTTLGVAAFCSQARSQDALLAALPPRFGEVWLGLLDRLESSALFSEESCSFSQSALLDNLDMWLQKAGEKLIG